MRSLWTFSIDCESYQLRYYEKGNFGSLQKEETSAEHRITKQLGLHYLMYTNIRQGKQSKLAVLWQTINPDRSTLVAIESTKEGAFFVERRSVPISVVDSVCEIEGIPSLSIRASCSKLSG